MVDKPNKSIIVNDKLKVLDKIDEGGQGEIFNGNYEDNEVVIKRYKRLNEQDLQEVKIYQILDHEAMVKFFGYFLDENKKLNIVLEKVTGLPLDFFILHELDKDTYEENLLSLKEKLIVILKISKFLIYLKQNNVIHRDLKPSNIMIVKNKDYKSKNKRDDKIDENCLKIKLFDFGISKISNKTFTYTFGTDKFTVNYSAPEQYFSMNNENDKLLISTKIDVWALGCIISYMFTGITPWSNKAKNIIKIQSYLTLKKTFPIPEIWFEIPEDIKKSILQIIELCLKIEPNDRINPLGINKLINCILNSEDFSNTLVSLDKDCYN